MRFLNIFRQDESPELRQLRELYQSSEQGEPLPDTSPEVRQEFEAQQHLQTQISQLASSASPENASGQRGALLSRLAEKRTERQSQEVLPVFGQLFKGRTVAAVVVGLLLVGVVATAGASNTGGHVTDSFGDVLDTLQITQHGPDAAGEVPLNGDAAGSSTSVQVCHVPEDDAENVHTISISEAALETHLAHGDTEGPCEDAGLSERVLVCHMPDDGEGDPFTLLLPESAVAEHLGHGDFEGACPDSPEPRHGPPFDVPRGEGNGPPFDVPRGTPDGEDNGPPFDVPRGEGNGPPFDVPVGGGEENNGPPFDLPNSPTGE